MNRIPDKPKSVFRGVYTAGNPLTRPDSTAQRSHDFRVMQGYWLRLRSGRKARANHSPNEIIRFHWYKPLDAAGHGAQWCQLKIGNTVRWSQFLLSNYVLNPFGIAQIDTTYDGAYALTNPSAIWNLQRYPVFYNGLGARTANSRPALTFFGTSPMYFGLDAYCPDGNPTVSFTAGAGFNTVQTGVSIWVGLYNTQTAHYSAGVYAGRITEQENPGVITVSNLQALKWAAYDLGEQSVLRYVFYATIDGPGAVPYLILNGSLPEPYTVGITSNSASLSLAGSSTNGWVLNVAAEMPTPTTHAPPRPMRSICAANGRLYGAPLQGGTGSPILQQRPGVSSSIPDFSYQWTAQELASVVWSGAPGDTQFQYSLGDPLQCWPLTYRAYTPSAEQPLLVYPLYERLDEERASGVFVLTATHAFILRSVTDSIHRFETVSSVSGIQNIKTFQATKYGYIWVDQRNQVVLMPLGGGEVRTLSSNWQNLMTAAPTCSDYILDPTSDTDAYHVYLSDATCVVVDFAHEQPEAYKYTGQDYTAAATVMDAELKQHHMVARTAIYTHEAQPETGLVPTTDETYVQGTSAIAKTEIVGEWVTNWMDFGSDDDRKELAHIDTTGDGDSLMVEMYGDGEDPIEANLVIGQRTEAPQTPGLMGKRRFLFATAYRTLYQFFYRLQGHSADAETYPSPDADTSFRSRVYGSILRLKYAIRTGQNRI